MTIGRGAYDEELTQIRERVKAIGAILIVFEGHKGSGFSAQLPPFLLMQVAEVLENMASQIRKDREQPGPSKFGEPDFTKTRP